MTTNIGLYASHGIISPIVSPVPHESSEIHDDECLLRREKIPRSLCDERFYIAGDDKSECGHSLEKQNNEDENIEPKGIRINKKMLLYKAFYFLFYGAIGSLFPYLAVFYKQLYLSAQQVGFLIGVRPFIQMGAVPLWGALADTYNVKKIILIMSIMAWLATNYSISIVRTPPETACNMSTNLLRIKEIGKAEERYSASPKIAVPENLSLITFLYDKHLNSSRNGFINDHSNDHLKRLSRGIISDLLEYAFDGRLVRNPRNPVSKQTINKKFNLTKNFEMQRMIAADELESEFDSINTDEEFPWPLDHIEEKPNKKEEDEVRQDSSKIFIVLIVITLVGTLLASPAATLADTATLENLGEKTYLYGFQRLWGAFGWGFCAFAVGVVVSGIQNINCTQGRHVDYILSFYVYAVMMGLACIIAFFFKFKPLEDQLPYTESLWEAIKLFSDLQHLCFVITLLISGASMGFIHTFLFWHLHDLGGTQLLFSVVSGIQCISEVLMYLFSGYLMLNIGCENVLYIGLTANVIRFFGYSMIDQPICSVPLEILQGISSASIWTAAVCYIGLIPGTPVTLQALLHGIYWGLGHGGGGILGGVLVSCIGSHITFLFYGSVCFLNLLILVLMKYWAKILNLLGNYTYVENIPSGTYILTHNRRSETPTEN